LAEADPVVREELKIAADKAAVPRPRFAETLAQAIACATRLEGLGAGAAARLQELRDRLAQGRLHLAVLGQFKRGKSTFLNALLGEPLLPTSVVPLTAIPTLIEGGDNRFLRILFDNHRPPLELQPESVAAAARCLEQHVTEAGNPNNRLGVVQAELRLPATLLANGIVLIDTPGIGSTLGHNTETTLNFLPQCDAALFLISADPPMTDTEADFLDLVRAKVSRIYFVLNKADYLSAADLRTATDFFHAGLSRRLGAGEPIRIFPVSARRGLEAKLAGDRDQWQRCGMAEVERLLVDELSREKQRVLHEAISAKAAAVLAELRMAVDLAVRSCELPQAELEKRMALLEQRIREAQQQRLAAQDVLAGDRRRTIEYVENLAHRMRKEAGRHLLAIADDAVAKATSNHEQETAMAALTQAIPEFFLRESRDFAAAAVSRLHEVLQPHQEQLVALVESVRQYAADIFEIQSCRTVAEDRLELPIEHHWTTEKLSATLPVISPVWLDRILPAGTRRNRVRQRLANEIEGIVNTNVERIRWSVLQKLADAFRSFSARLDERLNSTIQGIHEALQAAVSSRDEQASEIIARVERLKASGRELTAIGEALGAAAGTVAATPPGN